MGAGTKDAQGRFLHDFSYAGYHHGEKELPTSPPGEVYDVTQAPYNADNTGTTNASEAIQRAIDDAGLVGGGSSFSQLVNTGSSFKPEKTMV